MQQAFPFNKIKAWDPSLPEEITKAVMENPVVVVGKRGCCLVHVVRRLLQGQGVNPTVCEVSDKDDAVAVGDCSRDGEEQKKQQLPVIFIGGRLVGGLNQLMAVHISGELVPILRDAGALWL